MVAVNRWPTLDELAGYLKLSRSKLYRIAQDEDVLAFRTTLVAFWPTRD